MTAQKKLQREPCLCSRDSSMDLSSVKNFEIACGREAGWTRREQWSPTHGHCPQIRRRGQRCQCSSTASSARSVQSKTQARVQQQAKTLQSSDCQLVAISARQTPRDKTSGSDDMKQSAGKKKRLICCKCRGKSHPARLRPSADDGQDVDEVGTEPSSDAEVWTGTMTPLRPSTQ